MGDTAEIKTSSSVFPIGSTVDGYEFLAVLANTENDESYKVRNISAQRLEVLKVLACHSEYSLEAEERFMREMHVHARLIHPNIISFYTATILQERLIMTSEFADGVTLAQKLGSGPVSWREALEYASQVLSALDYAHSRAVMHRNIIPENIILTRSGIVKLTGFDLAKGLKDKKLTELGSIMGATRYMSPEQVKGLIAFDVRSDIYSLGVVLYETLTGKAPFECKSQFDLMFAHVQTIPAPPGRINASIPPEVDAMVLKALEKDPMKRFQSAEEFRGRIALALADRVKLPPAPAAVVTPVPAERVPETAVARQYPPPAIPAPEFAEIHASHKFTIAAALVLLAAVVLLMAFRL